MTAEIWIAVTGTGAALLAVIMELVSLLSRGRPEVHAELVERDNFVDLQIRNIGKGIALNVRIEVKQFPEAASQKFRQSRYFIDCLPRIASDQLIRIPRMINLKDEFWAGKGLEHSQPLILVIRYQIRGFMLQWPRKKQLEMPVGVYADLVQAGHSPVTMIEDW